MKRILNAVALLLIMALITVAAAQDAQTPQELCDAAQPAQLTMMQFQAAEDVLVSDVDYRAIFCTSAGAIYVDLYQSLTPATVNNFVFLAQSGYYDGTSFHRVIPDFMAQGGDPTATGRGGPGYQFGDEPIGFLTFDRPGLLAMANAGPGTNGSQFFITTAPTPHLNYKHTIFGDVLLGYENVTAIRERDPQAATDSGEALQTVLIITDPETVDNSGIVEREPATQEDVIAAFEAFSGGLPPAMPLIKERSGVFNAGQLGEALPDDLRERFMQYADHYDHQFRYSLQIANGDCDSSVFFSTLGYQVDVFANGQSAAAALSDNLNRELLESEGFEHDAFTSATYTRDEPTCDGGDGLHVLSLYTRGRYLVTIDVLVPTAVLDQAPANQLLDNLAMQIEGALASIFRGEIR